MWDTWEALTSMYGASFTSQYGEEPPSGWRYALTGLKTEDVMRGLEHCRDAAREFPPNATVFRAFCFSELPRQRSMRLAEEAASYAPALPPGDAELQRRRDVAAPWIAKCREILNKRGPD